MPSAWMLGPFVMKVSLIVSVISLILGLVFFRLFSPFADLKETKAREDDLFTLSLSFIITLWLGKIITRFFTFIHHPQAVLAYPADKLALYAAIVMTGIYAMWHFSGKRKRVATDILLAGLMVVLVGQFLYTFSSLLFGIGSGEVAYLFVYALLLVIIVFGKERLRRPILACMVFMLFGLGQWILGLWWTSTFFQFYPDAAFWAIVFAIGAIGWIRIR